MELSPLMKYNFDAYAFGDDDWETLKEEEFNEAAVPVHQSISTFGPKFFLLAGFWPSRLF